MKKTVLLFVLFITAGAVFPQDYDIEKLKIISKIWGESYLFHPSIIRGDKNVEWEKQLVDFLPQIKNINTNEEFAGKINSGLLSALEDPMTCVQPTPYNSLKVKAELKSGNYYDYLKIYEEELSELSSLVNVNSRITDRTSQKPLIVDLRINKELQTIYQTNTFFDYFSSMLISEPVKLSLSVTREHLGWDEYNEQWYYEQRWKIAAQNKQTNGNGILKPFKMYFHELMDLGPGLDFENYEIITRLVYFLINNSFISYYGPLLDDLRASRKNTFIINEQSGETFAPADSKLKKYEFPGFNFILNTAFYINNGSTGYHYDLETSSIDENQIIKLINSEKKDIKSSPFSLEISPAFYQMHENDLSKEEKIMGVIKIWTVIKYFHIYKDMEEYSIKWDKSLDKYLELVQNTNTDKEYYELIQKMMSPLNDSHVSTFHTSILDFSNLFVVPVSFEWIEEKVIITKVDDAYSGVIKPGNEIISIDGQTINEILENAKKEFSYSNNQSLLSAVITPMFFIGAPESIMKLEIKDKNEIKTVELARSEFAYDFAEQGSETNGSKILDGNTGYLNLALLTEYSDLESGFMNMKNTNGLILDLRNSYPTVFFHSFLEMLTDKERVIRIDEVPVVSAENTNMREITESKCKPDRNFTYDKKIVVLIDKSMISRPEDIAIALKAFPNVTFVGEQTQGTDGEQAIIHLPGGGTTSFTGQLIKFGNGEDFQGIGIMPDIEVKRTVKGVINGEDEILNKALEILRNK